MVKLEADVTKAVNNNDDGQLPQKTVSDKLRYCGQQVCPITMKHQDNHKRLKTNTLNCASTEGLHAWIRFTITGFNVQWAIQQFRRGFRYQIAYSTEYALPKVIPQIKKQFHVYKKKITNRGKMHFHYIQGQYFLFGYLFPADKLENDQ